MFHLKFLFAALAIFKIVSCLPVEEKIQPVDLAYNCIKAEKDEESKTKSPVLLIHGLAESRNAWNNLILLLASRTKREVCAVDLRNHGDSPWNNRTDVEALATDIGHFLDKRGIKKVNLIGHSLGGKTAMHFTLKHPDRVDSIVTEDINPNTISKDAVLQVANLLEIMNAALQSIPQGASQEGAKKSILNFINKKFEEMGSSERMPESFVDSLELKLTDGRWRFKFNIVLLIEFLKNIERFWTESSGLYEGPALFIYGTISPFKVNEDKENILKLFPKAELFPVEGAGHNIQGIFPEFDDAVIRFLNKIHESVHHHAPQPYKFGYDIKDKHGEQYRQEEGNGGHAVTGSYGFTDARGVKRQVNYVADHAGLAQVKTNEPGNDNQNPTAVLMMSDAPYAGGMALEGLGLGGATVGGYGVGNVGLGYRAVAPGYSVGAGLGGLGYGIGGIGYARYGY